MSAAKPENRIDEALHRLIFMAGDTALATCAIKETREWIRAMERGFTEHTIAHLLRLEETRKQNQQLQEDNTRLVIENRELKGQIDHLKDDLRYAQLALRHAEERSGDYILV